MIKLIKSLINRYYCNHSDSHFLHSFIDSYNYGQVVNIVKCNKCGKKLKYYKNQH